MTDPTTPPCLSDEPLPAAVREADAMLGMWAEMFRRRRTTHGVESALETLRRGLGHLPEAEVRNLLHAALIRLTEPAS
jgi:acyl-CoA hydrolase